MSVTNPEATIAITAMKQILEWTVTNPGATITTIATVFIAVSAVVTVFLTWVLARENKLLRKAETEPEVVAYLIPDPLHYRALNFVLANVGRGPACRVSFRLEANAKDLEDHHVALRNSADRKAISYLPQGEKISTFFGSSIEVMKEPRLRPFDVVIEYYDMKGEHRCKRCQLDVAQFDGFSRIGNPPEKDVADALTKIEGHLKGVARTIDNMGEIPRLLETYIWRALKKPEALELSEEAKAILKAAARNGTIIHRRYMGGQEIQAGGEALIPDQAPRTIVSWVGGLEDLRRWRYIQDLGYKGEMFEVTREGYKAVDEFRGDRGV